MMLPVAAAIEGAVGIMGPAALSGLLGFIDRYVVELVVDCSWTVDEITRMLLGPDPVTGETADRDRSHIGHRLRLSLRILARRWHPHQRPKLRSHRDPDAKPTGTIGPFKIRPTHGRNVPGGDNCMPSSHCLLDSRRISVPAPAGRQKP
jgi:hypothetical protein